jgi:formate hydrogenlyase subunit 3/multisubunit Na+/H+ antiporter MnhD subunit
MPLARYVIAVIVVMAVILCAIWFMGDNARFRTFAIFFGGFLMGMLAMFIAVHLYKY